MENSNLLVFTTKRLDPTGLISSGSKQIQIRFRNTMATHPVRTLTSLVLLKREWRVWSRLDRVDRGMDFRPTSSLDPPCTYLDKLGIAEEGVEGLEQAGPCGQGHGLQANQQS
jgi:hypothetical protein